MLTTRRDALKLGAAFWIGAAAAPTALRAAPERHPDVYKTAHGEITIQPIGHASFVMTVPGLVIYNDPIGGGERYAGQPAPDLILITHQHEDHYDPKTLAAIVKPGTKLVTNPAVHDMLPPDLKEKATAIGNGAVASGSHGTAIGEEALASGLYGQAIGAHSVASGSNSIAVGVLAEALGIDSIAIGTDITAGFNDSIAIGDETTSVGAVNAIAINAATV